MHIVQMMMLLWLLRDSKETTYKHNFPLYQPQGVCGRKEVCKVVWEPLLETSSPSFLSPSRTRWCQVPTLMSGQPQALGRRDGGNDVILLPSHCSM